MKITLLCHEIPYPPNHGGRVDMWRRILAFHSLGVRLQIVAWRYENPEESIVDELKKHAESIVLIPIERSIRYRVRRIPHYFQGSLYAGLRWPSSGSLEEIAGEVKKFQPACVWLDGFHGGLLALYLKETLGVPFFYRSQNIEHLYLRRLMQSSTGMRSFFSFAAGQFRLKAFEEKLIGEALCTYDISLDDLEFWKRRRKDKIRWLPPLLDAASLNRDSQRDEKFNFDVLFLGNLNTENNVAALKWFLEKVFPSVRREFPECILGVAGSKPSSQVLAMCNAINQVKLIPNPGEIIQLLQSSRVLVNPMLSGSGVKLKSLDMLATGRPVVSTPQGVSGLPVDIKNCFVVADAPDSFARAILDLLQGAVWIPPDKEWLGEQFGLGRIQILVKELAGFLDDASFPRGQ